MKEKIDIKRPWNSRGNSMILRELVTDVLHNKDHLNMWGSSKGNILIMSEEKYDSLIQDEKRKAIKDTVLFIASNIPTIMPHDKRYYIFKSDFDRTIKQVEEYLSQLNKEEE